MFDSQWPWWANLIALAIILFVKHLIVQRIENTAAYKAKMSQGQGWMAFLNVISGLNGILTFLIFLIPVGLVWAIVYGLIDVAVHWLLGYYKIKKQLPTVSAGNVTTAKGWFGDILSWYQSLSGVSYLSMAASAIGLLSGKGSLLTTVESFLKGL
jgi:hypothetical protein